MFQISFSGVLGTPTITDNVFFFPANPAIVFDYTCIINPVFWVWSAGSFFLKDVVTEYYYENPGGGTHNPVTFSLTYVKAVSLDGPSILNVPFGVSTTPNYFPLPPPTQPYWRNGDEP
jgi:hypothetical protein